MPSKDSDIEVELFQYGNLKKYERMDLQEGVYKLHIFVPWVPEVLSRVRRGASFRRQQADTCSAEGRRHEETGNRNRKPHMKSL